MIYKGTSVSLLPLLWLGSILGVGLAVALVYYIAVGLLYALPFLGALLWYLWWLDHGKSGAARVLGGRPPESPARRHQNREMNQLNRSPRFVTRIPDREERERLMAEMMADIQER